MSTILRSEVQHEALNSVVQFAFRTANDRHHDAIVIPTAALWAAAGGWLGRLLDGERGRRVVGLGLAALLAVSVVAIWR